MGSCWWMWRWRVGRGEGEVGRWFGGGVRSELGGKRKAKELSREVETA